MSDFAFRKDVLVCTGFTFPVVKCLAQTIGVDIMPLIAALTLVHQNVGDEFLGFAMRAFNQESNSRQAMQQKVKRVLVKSTKVNLSQPGDRFEYTSPEFGNTTCIVDGVPCYCRGPGEMYNGKHRAKSLNFQVQSNISSLLSVSS
jgi:hypothetical protein